MKKAAEKNSIIEKLIWIPAAAAACMILSFSLQPGETSGETSGTVTAFLIDLFGGDALSISEDKMALLDGIVRKLAHLSEYAFLSFLTGLAITVNGFKRKLRFAYTAIMCLAVSVSDEFLQIFVPGRNGDLKDVCVDMCGVMIAALIIYYIGKGLDKRNRKETVHGRRPFMNFYIDDIGFDEAVDRVMEMSKKGKHYLVTPNADHVMRLSEDPDFLKIYQNADLVTTDGTPLMWIAESQGNPIRERVTGADLLPAICERAAKEGKSVFFLGGAGDTAERAAKNLKEKYKGLDVAGVYVPPMGFEKDKEEVEKAVKAVNDASPDILFVCLGMPKQERFITDNKEKLDCHISIACGAAIDFAAGTNIRAPKWMRNSGLEWFYRFMQEPGRLFHRYFVVDTRIFLLAWKYRKGFEDDHSN